MKEVEEWNGKNDEAKKEKEEEMRDLKKQKKNELEDKVKEEKQGEEEKRMMVGYRWRKKKRKGRAETKAK